MTFRFLLYLAASTAAGGAGAKTDGSVVEAYMRLANDHEKLAALSSTLAFADDSLVLKILDSLDRQPENALYRLTKAKGDVQHLAWIALTAPQLPEPLARFIVDDDPSAYQDVVQYIRTAEESGIGLSPFTSQTKVPRSPLLQLCFLIVRQGKPNLVVPLIEEHVSEDELKSSFSDLLDAVGNALEPWAIAAMQPDWVSPRQWMRLDHPGAPFWVHERAVAAVLTGPLDASGSEVSSWISRTARTGETSVARRALSRYRDAVMEEAIKSAHSRRSIAISVITDLGRTDLVRELAHGLIDSGLATTAATQEHNVVGPARVEDGLRLLRVLGDEAEVLQAADRLASLREKHRLTPEQHKALLARDQGRIADYVRICSESRLDIDWGVIQSSLEEARHSGNAALLRSLIEPLCAYVAEMKAMGSADLIASTLLQIHDFESMRRIEGLVADQTFKFLLWAALGADDKARAAWETTQTSDPNDFLYVLQSWKHVTKRPFRDLVEIDGLDVFGQGLERLKHEGAGGHSLPSNYVTVLYTVEADEGLVKRTLQALEDKLSALTGGDARTNKLRIYLTCISRDIGRPPTRNIHRLQRALVELIEG